MAGSRGDERDYQRGETITAQARPRVLLIGVDDSTLVERLRQKLPTVRAQASATGVDLHEWDCVVTNRRFTELEKAPLSPGTGYGGRSEPVEVWTWQQFFPPHVSIVYAPTKRPGHKPFEVLDFEPSDGEDDALPPCVLVQDKVDGDYVSYVEGLPPAGPAPGRAAALLPTGLLGALPWLRGSGR